MNCVVSLLMKDRLTPVADSNRPVVRHVMLAVAGLASLVVKLPIFNKTPR